MDFVEHMLDSQRAVMIPFETLKEEFETCLQKYEEAFIESRRRLSRENEKGLPVMHGCRMVIDLYASYWQDRVRSVRSLINRASTREEQLELYKKHPHFNSATCEFTTEHKDKISGQ
jgi:hypothetical protein